MTTLTKPRKVSIGMPVYNGALLIKEALDSLLAQTFTDFELIISDNASTDDTEAICREYVARDRRIRYTRRSENRGPVSNFQYVLDDAVGEYFMWASHDDEWDPDFLKCGLSALQANEKAVLAFGCVRYVQRGVGMFMLDAPPYRLSGGVVDRVREYLTVNITDNLIYGLFRTCFLRANPLDARLVCPEKLLIAKAIAQGGVADAEGMSYTNYYSFKGKADLMDLGLHVSRWQFIKLDLIALWAAMNGLTLKEFVQLLPLALRNRVPGFRVKMPNDHSGRKRYFDPMISRDQI